MPILIACQFLLKRVQLFQEIKELALNVYYKKGKEDSVLYEDANDGYDYTKGRYSLKKFNLAGYDNKLIIRIHKTGTYITPYNNFIITLFGLPFEVKSIKLDNEDVSFNEVAFKNNTLVVTKEFTNLQIEG